MSIRWRIGTYGSRIQMLSESLLAKLKRHCPPLQGTLEAQGPEALERDTLPVLLLLAAARAPVSRLQLRRWAGDTPAVERVLEDLGETLRPETPPGEEVSWSWGTGEARFAFANPELRRTIVRSRLLATSLKQANSRIATAALREHEGRWLALDGANPDEMYDLRFIVDHLRAAGQEDRIAPLFAGGAYASRCREAALSALYDGRFALASRLFQNAVAAESSRSGASPTERATRRQALDLMNAAGAACGARAYEQALQCYEDAVRKFSLLLQQEQRRDERGIALERAELVYHIGACLVGQAGVLSDLGQPEKALQVSRVAVGVFRSPAAARGGPCEGLAMALDTYAARLLDAGRFEEAAATAGEAVAAAKVLLRPDSSCWQWDNFAGLLMLQSRALAALQRGPEALIKLEAAVSIRRHLSSSVSNSLLAENLLEALEALAALLSSVGHPEQAGDALTEARKMRQALRTAGALLDPSPSAGA